MTRTTSPPPTQTWGQVFNLTIIYPKMTHTIFHFSEPMKLSKLCSVSYCSSSHSSPKFSIIVLSEVFPVAFDCCALGFSLFFSWSTEKRSRSCPVSMVNRLELSCEITVLAMFSLNFWSLTEKKKSDLKTQFIKYLSV